VTFSMEWLQSHRHIPQPFDAAHGITLATTRAQKWIGRVPAKSKWLGVVKRSLITLKALTHWETGGIVAAATTSLPEELGGERNWDYRYCWLRDASFTLQAFMAAGYKEEASAWRKWLDRAVAGSPADLQIMYGIAGERRLAEWQVDWLDGYEGSKPVRVGNAAAGQTQLDVYGELLDTLYQGHKGGLPRDENSWNLRVNLLEHLELIWSQPDEGIWEVRGGRQQFVHSKVMAWVAFDRAIRSVEEFGYDGPVDHWRGIREAIHQQICTQGYDAEMGSFVQAYGSKLLDASLLLLTVVGFLPPTDHRIIGTVAAIERELLQGGFVRRYNTTGGNDGLSGTEGVFLACSFWLVDNYTMLGRLHDAETLFEKLIALRNDLGLFSEEYDTVNQRMIGNFPQAFTHVALVNSALRLCAQD
jgi:GH15 family glucan-1,4-alpha-glucosidase